MSDRRFYDDEHLMNGSFNVRVGQDMSGGGFGICQKYNEKLGHNDEANYLRDPPQELRHLGDRSSDLDGLDGLITPQATMHHPQNIGFSTSARTRYTVLQHDVLEQYSQGSFVQDQVEHDLPGPSGNPDSKQSFLNNADVNAEPILGQDRSGLIDPVKAFEKTILETPKPKVLHSCSHKGCDKSFGSKEGLRSHQGTHNTIITSKHECSICGQGFRYPRELLRHASKHSKVRAFQCSLCPKNYLRLDHLQRHQKEKHLVRQPSDATPASSSMPSMYSSTPRLTSAASPSSAVLSHSSPSSIFSPNILHADFPDETFDEPENVFPTSTQGPSSSILDHIYLSSLDSDYSDLRSPAFDMASPYVMNQQAFQPSSTDRHLSSPTPVSTSYSAYQHEYSPSVTSSVSSSPSRKAHPKIRQ